MENTPAMSIHSNSDNSCDSEVSYSVSPNISRPGVSGVTAGPGAGADGESNLISLKWNDSESFILSQLRRLWNNMEMTDVHLSCEGRMFKAHKLILTLWSPYFRQLFDVTSHCSGSSCPIIIFRDTLAIDLERLLQFMYQGQVFIGQKDADRFLRTAESLQIAGLSENIRRCTAAVISTSSPEKDRRTTSTSAQSVLSLSPVDHQEYQQIPVTTTASSSTTESAFLMRQETSPSNLPSFSGNLGKTKKKRETISKNQSLRSASFLATMPQNTAESLNKTDDETIETAVAAATLSCTYASPSTTTTNIASTSSINALQSNNNSNEDMILSQAMQLQMEPIPIHEVEEAVAAANAASSCTSTDGQSLLLLTLNQSDIFPDQEIGRDHNNMSSNNSMMGSRSTISPYASFILPDLEHSYTSTIEGGTFSSTFGNEIILPQHVTILQQSVSGLELQGGSQYQVVHQQQQQSSNGRRSDGRFVKLERKDSATAAEIQYVNCPKCGKFVKEQSLKVHLKRSHLAEGVILQCPICPKKLKSKGVYYKHMFMHRQKGEITKTSKLSQKQGGVKPPYNGKPPKKPNTKKGPKITTQASDSNNVGQNEPGPSSASSLTTSSTSVILYRAADNNNIIGANSETLQQQQYQYQFEQL